MERNEDLPVGHVHDAGYQLAMVTLCRRNLFAGVVAGSGIPCRLCPECEAEQERRARPGFIDSRVEGT